MATNNCSQTRHHQRSRLVGASVIATAALLGACGGMPHAPMMAAFSQASLPTAVQVPAGHRVALETVGAGTIVYECRDKAAPAGQAAMPGAMEWFFVGPAATLSDRKGTALGRYFGPPATWVASDGSAVTGAQVAVAPAAAGAIALQLVKANPATGNSGAMTGVSYIQRVATQGGVPPARACDAAAKGQRETVNYRADYIFWKAA